MGSIAIVTDSNSGIRQHEAAQIGVSVIPMPFTVGEMLYYEDISLSQEQFYQMLRDDLPVKTSQPNAGDLIDAWTLLLKDHDEIVYLPMSSGLSGSCETATALAVDFEGKVNVVNNQRISVTLKQSVTDAVALSKAGYSGADIKKTLESTKMDSSIYIMVDTLKYLKKGGRVTPAAAAIGTILNIKPVLQINGDKLDAFTLGRNVKHAKRVMIDAMKRDFETRFASFVKEGTMRLFIVYSHERSLADDFASEVQAAFPDIAISGIDSLSLSVACHIGEGALAIASANALVS
jgi:DegV family protein with EDD domain